MPTGLGGACAGINEQVGKAEKAVAGKIPVKRNRFVVLSGAEKSVNRALETKARTLAQCRVVPCCPPIYHRKEDSIRAHLAIVMAALAITRLIEARSEWSIKKFVTTAPPLPDRRNRRRQPNRHRRRSTTRLLAAAIAAIVGH